MYVRREKKGKVSYVRLKCPRCKSKDVRPLPHKGRPGSKIPKNVRIRCMTCANRFSLSKYPEVRTPDDIVDFIKKHQLAGTTTRSMKFLIGKEFKIKITEPTITRMCRKYGWEKPKKKVRKGKIKKCKHTLRGGTLKQLLTFEDAKGRLLGKYECSWCEKTIYRTVKGVD